MLNNLGIGRATAEEARVTPEDERRSPPAVVSETEERLRRAYLDVGKAVADASGGSALRGLEIVAMAFAALLDTYAKPNSENPHGMCDDPEEFRRYFAKVIAGGGEGLLDG